MARTPTDVELANAEWTGWYNNRRLHGERTYICSAVLC